MATEYVRGLVKELGHIDTSGASPADVPWGKTTEDGLAFTPGSVRREQLFNGQDYGPVDSQRTRIEGTSVRFRMAQADPLTIARTLGLPEDAVTGTGTGASLTVKQKDMGAREFHLY